MDFAIREATQEDYSRLIELFAEVDALHRKALPKVFRKADGPARTEEYIFGIIANGDACLFVAEHHSQVVGFAQGFIRQAPDIPVIVPRRYGVVDDVVVREGFRRSGVGRSLVKRVEQWVLEKGVFQVELNVWEFNKGAMAFYEEVGYLTASRKMQRWLSEDAGGHQEFAKSLVKL